MKIEAFPVVDSAELRTKFRVLCEAHNEYVSFEVSWFEASLCSTRQSSELYVTAIAETEIQKKCPGCIAARKPVYESKWPEGAEL